MSDRRRPAGDEWRNNLEARLRGLSPPPVPAELEAKLLAAIPPRRRRAHYRRPLLFRTVLALAGSGLVAAAMLVVVLAIDWGRSTHQPGKADGQAVPGPQARATDAQPPDAVLTWHWAARRADELADPAGAPFDWPLETRPVAAVGRTVESDLFD